MLMVVDQSGFRLPFVGIGRERQKIEVVRVFEQELR